eukprot:GILK01025455.1.p1 GENE.GILK01025455.1~~GILK01025455.1.p1  ORF type:complete len:134 (-),score=20.83 GILK01025455.1:222-596(-)
MNSQGMKHANVSKNSMAFMFKLKECRMLPMLIGIGLSAGFFQGYRSLFQDPEVVFDRSRREVNFALQDVTKEEDAFVNSDARKWMRKHYDELLTEPFFHDHPTALEEDKNAYVPKHHFIGFGGK